MSGKALKQWKTERQMVASGGCITLGVGSKAPERFATARVSFPESRAPVNRREILVTSSEFISGYI